MPDRPPGKLLHPHNRRRETFVEVAGFGAPLPEAPLYLTPHEYVRVPLEATYQSAWEAVPSFWRNVLTVGAAP